MSAFEYVRLNLTGGGIKSASKCLSRYLTRVDFLRPVARIGLGNNNLNTLLFAVYSRGRNI